MPIYLAAIGPRAIRLAGAVADGVLLNAYTPTAYVRYAVSEVRRAALDAGRDPAAIDIACMLVTRLTSEPASMWHSLKERLVRLLVEPQVGEVLLQKGGFDASILGPLRAAAERGDNDAASLITDEMVDAFYLVGDAHHCTQRVAEYRDAGVDLPLLLPRLEAFSAVARAFGRPGFEGV